MNDVFPAMARKLAAQYQRNVLLRRIQSSDFRQLLKAAAPQSINYLLYFGENPPKEHEQHLPFPVSVKSFSVKNLSGVDRIDKRLTPHRLVYLVFGRDEIVHENWVHLDTLMPSQYGFDSCLPVLGDALTQHQYRGNGLFPYTLSYILKDLKSRQVADRAYVLVSPTNKASIRGLEKAGFQRIAQLTGKRWFGLFITNKYVERAPELSRRLPMAS